MLHNYCMLLSWNGFIPGIAHLIHLYLHPGTFQSWVSNVSKLGCPEISKHVHVQTHISKTSNNWHWNQRRKQPSWMPSDQLGHQARYRMPQEKILRNEGLSYSSSPMFPRSFLKAFSGHVFLPLFAAAICHSTRWFAPHLNASSSEHTLNPQTPRVKREPLLRIREKGFQHRSLRSKIFKNSRHGELSNCVKTTWFHKHLYPPLPCPQVIPSQPLEKGNTKGRRPKREVEQVGWHVILTWRWRWCWSETVRHQNSWMKYKQRTGGRKNVWNTYILGMGLTHKISSSYRVGDRFNIRYGPSRYRRHSHLYLCGGAEKRNMWQWGTVWVGTSESDRKGRALRWTALVWGVEERCLGVMHFFGGFQFRLCCVWRNLWG